MTRSIQQQRFVNALKISTTKGSEQGILRGGNVGDVDDVINFLEVVTLARIHSHQPQGEWLLRGEGRLRWKSVSQKTEAEFRASI